MTRREEESEEGNPEAEGEQEKLSKILIFTIFFFKIKKSEAEALNADNVDSIFLK